jgi:hypothetical protein
MFTAAGLTVEISRLRNLGTGLAAIAGGALDVMMSSVVSAGVAHSEGVDLRTIAMKERPRYSDTRRSVLVRRSVF